MGDTSYETGKSPLATPLAVATVRTYKATALIPSINTQLPVAPSASVVARNNMGYQVDAPAWMCYVGGEGVAVLLRGQSLTALPE